MEEENKKTDHPIETSVVGGKKEFTAPAAVQTFTSDMVQVIEDSQGGLIKKIIDEQEKHEIEKKNFSPQSKRNRTFVLLSLILILMGTAILAFLYIKKLGQSTPAPEIKNSIAPLIFSDQIKYLALDGLKNDQITEKLFEEASNTGVKVGGVEAIYGVENSKIVSLRRFITLLKSTFVPGDTTFVDDYFMIGAVNSGPKPVSPSESVRPEGKDLFILIKVRSFVDIFEPMRTWEPKMFSELHALYGQDINSNTSYLLTKSFEDGTIDNKNARILYDNLGNPALMYVFADDHSVVIARTKDAVNEVILRLTGSQIKK
ncbi:hypothetical protein K2P96_00745 [Patescibacteria group bacterium]|nr:hypothetical protein [Patescibacteria group bacterium]